jgi:hypothetical protein
MVWLPMLATCSPVRHIFELWHSLDQIIDGKCSGFVTSLGTACLRASDNATGGKNFDLRFGLGGGGNRQREYRNEAAQMPDAFIHVCD